MSKVLVSCQVEVSLFDEIKRWAKKENRTISKLVESLLVKEQQRRDQLAQRLMEDDENEDKEEYLNAEENIWRMNNEYR